MKRLVLALISLTAAVCHAATPERPHVLFIAIDDLRPELGCYGASHVHSPNIDRFASEALLFNRAYTPMAVCMPARASLMSGYRPLTGKMYGRKAMVDHVPDALSLNQHFMNEGYETVTIGKIYHHDKDEAAGWTRRYRNIRGNWGPRGYVEETSLELERANKPSGRKGPTFENADVPDDGYQTAAFADKAIEELRNITNKPLFLALGFRKPHLPFNAPQTYWDLYDRDQIARTAFPDPPDGAAREGLSNWGELRSYHDMPSEGPLPEESALDLIHGYYACISYVDAQLGRVLAEVDRLGLRDNTVVVLWSDHGWKLGDYGMWCKHTNYEIDTRVPLIIRAPGMTEIGTKTDALVDLVDIYPTLCELSGISSPPHLDGLSFAPLLTHAQQPWKPAAFSIWAGTSAREGKGNIGYSMRYGDYRYTEWRRTRNDELVSRELYDQSRGTMVRKNLIDEPDRAALVSECAEVLRDGHRKTWSLAD